MRGAAIAVFVSIALLVYGAVNSYIFIRGWQALPRVPWLRIAYTALFVLAAGSFVAGRFLERTACTSLTTAIVWAGSFWLALMVYLVLPLLLLDLLRLSNAFLHWWPRAATDHHGAARLAAFCVVLGGALITVAAGHLNALSPRVARLELDVPKAAGARRELRIALASDIHLGTIIGNGRLKRLVAMVNAERPDIVLLAGDVVDEDIGRVVRDNLGEQLRQFRAPLGIYAVTGNHEYFGGRVEATVRYLEQHGVAVLLDRAVEVDSSFTLAGRVDRSGQRIAGTPRLGLAELLAGADRSRPVVLLDHQPFELGEAGAAGVDLQLSGHTHHGQLWPFNFITNRVYEKSWGYLRKGGTHVYVSSGYGTWGPPVRTGNVPEIAVITLRFAAP